MSNLLAHGFTSAKADDVDTSLIQPSHFGSTSTNYTTNPTHVFSGGALGSLLYRDTGSIDGASWLADVAVGSVLVSGGVGAAPAFSATPSLTDLTLTGVLKAADGTFGAPAVTFASDPDTGMYRLGSNLIGFAAAGALYFKMGVNQLGLATNPGILTFGSSDDLVVGRDGADILYQRRTTNAQTFRIYNTYTDASNYERLAIEWLSNVVHIRTQGAGTGTTRTMQLNTAWQVQGNGHLTAASDNAADIGASAANRPRNIFAAGGITAASPTTGIGYASGAGGTVTQATSKATGVTLSKVTGEITLNAAALAGDTTVSFVLTNTAIAATDVLLINHVSGGTAGSYSVDAQCGAGSATVVVRNVTTGSLSEAIVLRFALLKGATS